MNAKRDNILNKVRALLSKTLENGCTENEATVALAMAEKLMQEHEIDANDLNIDDEKAIIELSDMRDPQNIRWKLCYWISKFTDTLSFGNKKQIKFAGLKSDVEFAMWLAEALTSFVQAQLKSYMWANGYQSLQGAKRNRVINSFVIGCCSRINTKLKSMIDERKPTTNSMALVVAKTALINEAVKDLKIGKEETRGRKNKIEADAFQDGKKAGEKASFGRPVNQGGLLRLT